MVEKWVYTQALAGANVVECSRFTLERWDSPRHSSHVVQLFSLGGITHTMKYAIIFLTLSFLLIGCSRDSKLTKEIPGDWKQNGGTMTISRDGTFSFFRLWHEGAVTNTFAGTWQIRGGIMLMTLTNRSGPNPNIPAWVTPMQSRIIRLDDHQMVVEMDGKTNISSR